MFYPDKLHEINRYLQTVCPYFTELKTHRTQKEDIPLLCRASFHPLLSSILQQLSLHLKQ